MKLIDFGSFGDIILEILETLSLDAENFQLSTCVHFWLLWSTGRAFNGSGKPIDKGCEVLGGPSYRVTGIHLYGYQYSEFE